MGRFSRPFEMSRTHTAVRVGTDDDDDDEEEEEEEEAEEEEEEEEEEDDNELGKFSSTALPLRVTKVGHNDMAKAS